MMCYLLYDNQDIISENPIRDLSTVLNNISSHVLGSIKYNFAANLYDVYKMNAIYPDNHLPADVYT